MLLNRSFSRGLASDINLSDSQTSCLSVKMLLFYTTKFIIIYMLKNKLLIIVIIIFILGIGLFYWLKFKNSIDVANQSISADANQSIS